MVSIIVPVHNGERTLGRCLEALARQDGAPGVSEVIVADDGSTDGSAALAQGMGARVIRMGARRGPAAARNAGAREAQGEFLLFVDADCEPHARWVEEMLRPLSDPSVAAVYGAYRTRQTALAARFAQAEFEERYARLARRQHIDFLATHAAAFRTEVFRALGGFREDLLGNEDVELAYRLVQSGRRIAFAPAAYVMHEHAATLGAYLRTKASRGYWRTLVYARYPRKALGDDYTPPWLKLQVLGLALLLPAAAGALAWPLLRAPALLLMVGLIATTFPLMRSARGPLGVPAWHVAWLSLARAAALAAGVLAGLVAWVCGRRGS